MSPPLPETAHPQEVLRAALAALDGGQRVVVATVLSRSGSAPSTPGQKLALFADGRALGTVGGGAVERVVLASMASSFADVSATPRVETFRLGPNLGMCCGGSADILVEPLAPVLAVLVIGAGHVGSFVAPLLASVGFHVTLVDAREEAANAARLAPFGRPSQEHAQRAGVQVLCAEHDDPEVLAALGASPERAAFLVMTHDHQLDQAAIEGALRTGFAFVGGVGSRAKAVRTRERLVAKGFTEADVARVRMPIGVSIGARSPAEIGVSIAAELVAWRAALAPRAAAERSHAATPVEPSSA